MDRYPLRSRLGLLAGPPLVAALLLLPPPAGMAPAAWRAAAVGVLMALWWITEAIPIPATALLPLPLFPALGVLGIEEAAAPYADPIIFLFMGGFMLALAMQRWNLHRRVALTIIRAMGTRPTRLVAGFMAATAFLSMWVSNTATAVMMLPIGLSVVELLRAQGGEEVDENFQTALMLGIAYAASIGGFATLIGTPPNALVAGFMKRAYGVEIGFVQWMLVGVPLTLIVLPLCWLLLTRLFPIRLREIPGGRELIERELRALGPLSAPERWIMLVFGLATLGWIFRPFLAARLPGLSLSDAGIAIAAALLLFLLPLDARRGEFVLDWEAAGRLPWDVLLLFGGGLSLAEAIGETGLAHWIGARLGGLGALPLVGLVLVVVVVTVLLSEVASNTATAAAFLPVVGSLAVGLGENPFLLTIPAALAASCGFMLPVATPPNAIAYGTGYVTVPQMTRAGLLLDLLCIAAILALAYSVMLAVFGVELGSTPAWATGR